MWLIAKKEDRETRIIDHPYYSADRRSGLHQPFQHGGPVQVYSIDTQGDEFLYPV
jgi:hypothetical protein